VKTTSDAKPNLTVLHGRQPDSVVVEMLEDFLKRAKEGEIVGIAFAYEMSDGGYGHAVSRSSISTVGAVADMLHTLLDHRNRQGR